jgi:hypothetical protein
MLLHFCYYLYNNPKTVVRQELLSHLQTEKLRFVTARSAGEDVK